MRGAALALAVPGLLVACAEPATRARALPTPYDPVLDDPADDTPATIGELEAGLAEVVAYLGRLDPLLQHEAWEQTFWPNIDGDCPALSMHNGQDYWNDRCTTTHGAEFIGWSLNFRGGGWWEDGLYYSDFAWLSGHAVITRPDGVRLENYGDVMFQDVKDEAGVRTLQGFVYGDFRYSDPAAEGTWLQEPVTNETYYAFADTGDHRQTTLDAAIGNLPGPLPAVRLEGLVMSDGAEDCALEPSGRVQARDASGSWTTVDFGASGPGDDACDGCALALRDEVEVGTVCADFRPLVDWEDRPWSR